MNSCHSLSEAALDRTRKGRSCAFVRHAKDEISMMLDGKFMQYEIIFRDKVTARELGGKGVGGEGSGQRRMPDPVTMGAEVRGGEWGGFDWGESGSKSLGGGDSGSISRSWSWGDGGTSFDGGRTGLGRGDRGSKSFG